MQIHNLKQGTPEWHQFRINHDGASECAAANGLSKKMSRTDLLKMKKTGIAKVFSDYVQEKILDKGHTLEASARPIIEEQIGDDLYPVVCSSGRLSCSCDGRTLNGKIVWEHKQYAQDLFISVSNNELPEEHIPQCQQILLVTGAEKLLFTVSDGTEENMVSMWIFPDSVWFKRIQDGWDQFHKDLTDFVPVQIEEKPDAKAVETLPALFLQAEGRLVNSNLDTFRSALASHLAETRALVYVTDEDFSNAEAVAKMYRDTFKKLELAKEAMLEQTATIGDAKRVIDECQEDLRVTALKIEKDCKSNKEAKQINIINEGKIGFTTYVTMLSDGIAPIRLNYVMPNFADAIKGKRLFSAMTDAVQTMLANAKIELGNVAAGISANLNWFGQHEDHKFLFNDLQTIIYKPAEDFQLLVTSRIAEHTTRVEKDLADKLEAEHQKTLNEERARVEAVAVEAQRVKSLDVAPAPNQAPLPNWPHPTRTEASSVVQLAQRKSVESTPPNLRLGHISERLGFAVTAGFLRDLGFEHAGKDKAAILFHEYQFGDICNALINHINRVMVEKAA